MPNAHQRALSARIALAQLGKDPGGKMRKRYLAEANNRLAAPLYCLAFALIAMAAVTRGRRGRGVYALRLTVASLFAAAIRIVGYGVQGVAGAQRIAERR